MVLTLFCANFTIIINYDTTDLHKIKPPIFAPGSPFQSNRAGGFIPLPDTATPLTSRDLHLVTYGHSMMSGRHEPWPASILAPRLVARRLHKMPRPLYVELYKGRGIAPRGGYYAAISPCSSASHCRYRLLCPLMSGCSCLWHRCLCHP